MNTNTLRRRIVGAAVATLMLIPVAAQATPGDLDLTFGGGDGFVADSFGDLATTNAIAIQADGAAVVVGYLGAPSVSYSAFIARYTADGTLDAGYGTGGIATLAPNPTVNASFEAVAVQADGKAVAVGTTDSSGPSDVLVARYDASGALDATFGTGGYVTTDLGGTDHALDVAVDAAGRIVVVGYANGPSLLRYDGSGNLDPTFGVGGHAHWSPAQTTYPYDLETLANGKIVVVGAVGNYGSRDPIAARFTASGALDSGFGGGDGWVSRSTPDDDYATGLDIQSDGKLVVTGAILASTPGVFVGRLNPRGAIDVTFGGGDGYDEVAAEDPASPKVAVASDGTIVVSAFARHSGGYTDTTVARWTAVGTPDSTFGVGGVAQFDLGVGGLYDLVRGVALQPDGRIVVAGTTTLGNGEVAYLARFDAS